MIRRDGDPNRWGIDVTVMPWVSCAQTKEYLCACANACKGMTLDEVKAKARG
jgi:hypothetical protein